MRTLLLRTVEDPAVPRRLRRTPPAEPSLFLTGRVYALDATLGEVAVAPPGKPLGTAVACATVTSPLEAGVAAPFHLELTLGDGFYAASGSAHVVEADVPAHGVVIAACALRVVEAPNDERGVATSISVFDPRGASPEGTGSVWLLRLYGRG